MTDTEKPRAPAPSAPPAPPASSDSYHPDAVEAKWQSRWAERRTNEPDLERAERPFYNLMMFPYPSAEGLHVGNMFAFTGSDTFGRFQRLRRWTFLALHLVLFVTPWIRIHGHPALLIGNLDTGAQYDHPDLAANIWTNPGEIPGNEIAIGRCT